MKHFITLLMALAAISQAWAQLTPVSNFGTNPGNLNMYYYAPTGLSGPAPLVVVMHGCTQDAFSYASESDWNSLADEYGFYVVYPEQINANNSSGCFNWFESGDYRRGFGECRSIKAMVDYMKNTFSVDASRVHVTGFSAGGAMTTVMLATYPEVFASGAVMAGLPYRCATGLTEAFSALNGSVNLSPSQWASRVQNENPGYSGPWPKVAVFHGTSDFTVREANQQEIVEQWTAIAGADANADAILSNFNGSASTTLRRYDNSSGEAIVLSYSFNGMGHAIAIDPGSGPEQGGNAGSYTSDEDLWSSYWAADFFGLFNLATAPPAAPTNLSASALSDSEIALSWSDSDDQESSFVVERSQGGGSFAVIATLPANTTQYTDAGLSPSTSYSYRVKARNNLGDSPYSNSASATTGQLTAPPAPSNLSASAASASQIDLSWTDNASNETAYRVERSADGGQSFSLLATLGADASSYSDTGLPGSSSFTYRVQASNAAGASAFSNLATASTQAPTYVIEQLSGTQYLTFVNTQPCGQSFTVPTAGQLREVEVRFRTAVSNVTLRVYAGDGVSGTPLYTESGLSRGSGWQSIVLSNPLPLNAGSYTFDITNSSLAITYSNSYAGGSFYLGGQVYTAFDAAFRLTIEEGGAPAPAPPAAPSGLTATAVSATQIDLSWTDNANDETEYLVERRTGGGAFALVATLGADATQYSDTGLSAATNYTYRVKASNAAGDSPLSNEASATTQSSGGGGGGGSSPYVVEQLSGGNYLATLNFQSQAQSFTTLQAGPLTEVEVQLRNSVSNSTLRVYAGNAVSGTPLYEQSGISRGAGIQRIALSNPPQLQANSVYTVLLTSSAWGITFSDAYSGGSFWSGLTNYVLFDAYFRFSLGGSANRLAGARLQAQAHLAPNGKLLLSHLPAGDLQATLYDLSGRPLASQRWQDLSQGATQVWPLRDLPSGVYLLRLQQTDQQQTLRLLMR